MKALSIKNPWAYLIAWGIKDLENRSTRTKKIDERIYIHTSLTWAGKEEQRMDWDLLNEKQRSRLNRYRELSLIAGKILTGAIIGEVTIIDCVEDHSSIWAEPGKYHWRLKDPVLYDKPILNVKGKLSFWEYK